ncbi:MAG: ATP-binding protein [Chloroflexi bacterium]|nr:ATP-binding protein [Chloroflexota bacterium]
MHSLNLRYLRTHLQRLDVYLHQAVQLARQAGFDPENEFQGLYIAEDEIDRHLKMAPGRGFWGNEGLRLTPQHEAQVEAFQSELRAIEDEAQRNRYPLSLLSLIDVLGLTPEDLDILLAALAPTLDRRYERLYGYLQDDVTKRRPTINLAINLFGGDWAQRATLMSRLTDESPLLRYQLVSLVTDATDPYASFANHMLRIDPQITKFVQGIHNIPQEWQTSVRPLDNRDSFFDSLVIDPRTQELLARDYGDLNPIIHMYGNYGSGKQTLARAFSCENRYALLEINLQGLQHHLDLPRVRRIFREARLRHAVLLLTHWEAVLDEDKDPPAWLWDEIVAFPFPVILSGISSWEPRGVAHLRPILRLGLELPDFGARMAFWQRFLADTPVDPSELAYKFKLTGGQIRDAVHSAYDLALGRGEPTPTLSDLYVACRAQSNRKLSNLAVKITPRFNWESIVLPPDRVQQLHEICDQVRYAVQVYDRWGFQGRGASAKGLSALFAGQSGTGKTMAAEIIAQELGLELFKIDLSSVVSKYIGETEKNLAAIFDEATQSNAILFFDEADALFGKRSEVKDSHDRYANIETGYLLQRMETYDGVAILASNLRQNLDEAFTRRLDFMIDFPFPEDDDRQKIWRISFPSDAPLAPDVDLALLARRYRMAGGNIRNAALASAFLAAADLSDNIKMQHVMHAIRREHQKMGKLLD